MKKYNLYSKFENKKFLQVTKKEIFQLFDHYKRFNLFEIFCGDFNLRCENGNFFIKKITIFKKDKLCLGILKSETYKYFTVSAFKITDTFGENVDLENLILDYKKSRGLIKKSSKNTHWLTYYRYRNPDSQRIRKRNKQLAKTPFKNSKSKQFINNNEYLKEFENYNIKTKRSQKNIVNKYEW